MRTASHERLTTPPTTKSVIAEYEELTGFGLTFEAAASRMGLRKRTLERRFERAGYDWRKVAV